MSEVEVQKMDSQLVEVVSRAEYNQQVATAKQYPRSVRNFMEKARELSTLNEQVANDCIYALPRDGKTIEGPSARFAEIVQHAWGNVKSAARVVAEDERFVTAQAICHDLEANSMIAFEVRRKITNKHGKRYSDDMILTTANAAASIALRNAILKVVPKAFWSPIYEDAKRVVVGDAKTLANRRAEALAFLQKFGVIPAQIFEKLAVKGLEDITLDHLLVLRGMATALKDGDTTVEQLFAADAEPIEKGKKRGAAADKLKETHTEPVAPEVTVKVTTGPADGVPITPEPQTTTAEQFQDIPPHIARD